MFFEVTARSSLLCDLWAILGGGDATLKEKLHRSQGGGGRETAISVAPLPVFPSSAITWYVPADGHRVTCVLSSPPSRRSQGAQKAPLLPTLCPVILV